MINILIRKSDPELQLRTMSGALSHLPDISQAVNWPAEMRTHGVTQNGRSV